MVNWTEDELAAHLARKAALTPEERAVLLGSDPPTQDFNVGSPPNVTGLKANTTGLTSNVSFQRKRGDEEHQEQVSLMKWVEYQAPSCPALNLLFAIPNGGDRNVIVATRLKAEGVRAGVPDLFLAFPVKPYSGLFIEMKKKKGGRTSKEQKKWIDALRNQGYRAEVCAGADVAQSVILDYLEGRTPFGFPGRVPGPQIYSQRPLGPPEPGAGAGPLWRGHRQGPRGERGQTNEPREEQCLTPWTPAGEGSRRLRRN